VVVEFCIIYLPLRPARKVLIYWFAYFLKGIGENLGMVTVANTVG